MEDRIVLDGTEDELAGLPTILADLVRGNLEARPSLARVLDRLDGPVAVVAGEGDEATAATVTFAGGRMRVRAGADPAAAVRVDGSFEAILGLSRVPMAGPLPRPCADGTRAFLKDLRSGRLRIRGLFRAPGRLLGLMRLVSVG